jgi:sulfite reductase (ferredoxin)
MTRPSNKGQEMKTLSVAAVALPAWRTDVAFIRVSHLEHGPGLDLWVGGGLSTNPMLARVGTAGRGAGQHRRLAADWHPR